MPELPEVETIVRSLRERQGLVGRRLSQAELLWARTRARPTTAEFNERIPGQSITGLSRRGKFILIHLDCDTLLIHLRMSGDLRLDPAGAGQPPQNHDRLVLNFSDGDRLAFNDTRKFGRVWLAADPQTVLADLGPEPLDAAFSNEAFYQRLTARNRQLKPLLLDQTFLAGLGNIYTDEALHLARLHPLRDSGELAAKMPPGCWRPFAPFYRKASAATAPASTGCIRAEVFKTIFGPTSAPGSRVRCVARPFNVCWLGNAAPIFARSASHWNALFCLERSLRPDEGQERLRKACL
jgi:formamidopyrimidine-DNA glycosylase